MKILFLLILSFNLYSFDHDYKSLNKFYDKYVVKDNIQTFVKYKDIDKNELESVLKDFKELSKKEYRNFSENQKLAFLINAYNIFTIKLIVKNYPVKSIKDIGSLFTNPWNIEFIKILDTTMTLDEIEHETIRKNFNDYRIHFAVNCASISCPSLAVDAFIAIKLDDQLAKAESSFLYNKNKNFLKQNTMYVSKIFDWYEEDFENFGSIKDYISTKLKFNFQDIEYLEYNWNLNDYKKGQD